MRLTHILVGITFQPKLNNKSKQIGRNDKAVNNKNDGVFNRLYDKSKEYREKHQQRVEYAEHYDPSSGSFTNCITFILIYLLIHYS